jgi:hypothetical protein
VPWVRYLGEVRGLRSMTRSDASDGLGGRPGSTDNNDREQADKGEGNEDSSLHGAFFPVDWEPDRRQESRRIGRAEQTGMTGRFLGLFGATCSMVGESGEV